MVEEYLEKVHPNRLLQLRISPGFLKNNLRHIYFTDAGNYIYCPDYGKGLEPPYYQCGIRLRAGENLKSDGGDSPKNHAPPSDPGLGYR